LLTLTDILRPQLELQQPAERGTEMMTRLFRYVSALALLIATWSARSDADRPNILIITVDDMSADSIGAFGCELPGTSPHIDRLASTGMRFRHAHVVVGNCMPSRNVMWSGLYPHNNGVEGFYQVPDSKHPHLVDLMQDAGYFTGIFHKVSHSTPWHPYHWDIVLDTAADGTKRHVKNAADYGSATAQGIAAAEQAGKPFCLMLNVADPHKPFHAQGRDGSTIPDAHEPSRVFLPEEVPVPGFLFDDPVVRKELAHYYSSVRRADDCVGQILAALDSARLREETAILFLSDHGMPLPFAKTQLYHHSSSTPLFVIWPGVTTPGTEDSTHMVSAVDLLPTLLDIAGIEHPDRIDGRSFAPLLRGEAQTDRDYVIKEYNENAGASRDPMRAVQTKEHLYLFNPWSDGERVMATATTGTPTYRQLAHLAETDSLLAARHTLYRHRVPEELYLVQDDPDCLANLIDSVSHTAERDRLRGLLRDWMQSTGDPALEVFDRRNDADFVASWMAAQEQVADARRNKKQRAKRGSNQTAGGSGRLDAGQNLIRLQLPQSFAAGAPIAIHVRHKLPKQIGEQQLTVTIKNSTDGQRLDRKSVTISGAGVAVLEFTIPATDVAQRIQVAAFVGKDFASRLQHLQSRPIAVVRNK
jgi:N-sulfoglucosamine sulfohydrolase